MAEALARPEPAPPKRLFFGWWVVGAGAAIQFLGAALLSQAYGSYVVLLRAEFGWSKTVLSIASSLREAESGIIGPLQGSLLDRLGPRTVIRIGVVILGAGFMAFSQVESILTFYLAFVVMSVGMSMCGWTTITFAAVHWFERRRSTAISLTSAGFALGGIAVPITTWAMETYGWRETAFVSGWIVILLGFPLAQVIHGSPRDRGLGMDGDPLDAPGARDENGRGRTVEVDFTLREALHEPSFWWVSFGHASALFVVSAMSVHLISHLKESLGYSLAQAALVVTAMTFVQLFGTLSGGLIGDRFSKRLLVTICMGMHALGLLILSHATSVWMVGAFAVLHGLAWGWRGPQMAAIRADYFGRSNFGKILGVSNLVIIIGTISGPIIAGYLYDQTGNYRLGFDILAILAGLGSIFFILARKPSPPVRPGLSS